MSGMYDGFKQSYITIAPFTPCFMSLHNDISTTVFSLYIFQKIDIYYYNTREILRYINA